MAVQRVVDPNRFLLLGAITDWLGVYRRHVERARSPKEIMAERKLESTRIVQLRWLLAPEVGYPTEPFKVWRRPATPVKGEDKVSWSELNLIGLHVVVFDRPQVFVRLTIQSSGGGTVLAFGGGPFSSAIVATSSINAGTQTITLSGPAIQSVVLPGGSTLLDATGLDVVAAQDPNWQLVEIVGLPVDSSWSGLFDLDAPQGLVPGCRGSRRRRARPIPTRSAVLRLARAADRDHPRADVGPGRPEGDDPGDARQHARPAPPDDLDRAAAGPGRI